MKTIHIVTTKIGTGKGGISTALLGFYEQLSSNTDININLITSHDSSNKFRLFFLALLNLLSNCKKGDVVWLHCGPYVSIIRKVCLAIVGKIMGGEIYFHMHSPQFSVYLENKSFRFFFKFLSKFLSGVIVLTPWWKDLLGRKVSKLNCPILVVPNPLDTVMVSSASEQKSSRNLENCKIKILSMARVTDLKGFDLVIDTMSHLPSNYELTIAGDGPFLQDLKERSVRKNLQSRVTFLGWVNYNDKAALLKSHDIFCLPSKYDSFGMGFIEAMASGLPVVAYNIDAIPDVVPHKIAGYLIKNYSIDELQEAIIEISENLDDYGVAAKSYVLNKYHPVKVCKNLLSQFSPSSID